MTRRPRPAAGSRSRMGPADELRRRRRRSDGLEPGRRLLARRADGDGVPRRRLAPGLAAGRRMGPSPRPTARRAPRHDDRPAVAHFAEIDMQAETTPDSQALLLRPAARLVGGHRYAVAITNRVKAARRRRPARPARLRGAARRQADRSPAARGDAAAVRRRARRARGGRHPSDDLVVAWDFTVASDDFIHRDMIAARDRAISALASHRSRSRSPSDVPIDDGA